MGVGDVLEKDINLQIAMKVKKRLEKKKIDVIMVREEDKDLADSDAGSRKVQDMKERVKLINESSPELAVSIHQNSYHEPEIHGAQVFYYKHSVNGENDAKIMQKALLAVDKDNTRDIKADDTYYLLRRTQSPILIVECGFLSNPEEAKKLSSEEYQDEMAKAIASGIETCLKD